jgi:hypothetical protein
VIITIQEPGKEPVIIDTPYVSIMRGNVMVGEDAEGKEHDIQVADSGMITISV